jgi:hypothetical protein
MNTYMEGVRDALTRAGLVRNSTSAWVTGFAVGAGLGLVSGAVVALLLAPRTGPEMRREIGWRAKRLAERTQDAVSDAKQKLTAEIEGRRGRNEVGPAAHNEVPIG